MNQMPMPMPAIIVKKGGFLSALAYGFFGFLSVCVISAAGIGIYAIRSGDRVIQMVSTVLEHPERIRTALPPLLAEMFADRRAPEYRERVELETALRPAKRASHGVEAIVTVRNNGPETISVLGLNVVVQDGDGMPVQEIRAYAATPFMIDNGEWRGPLAPGAERKFVRWISADRNAALSVASEIVDLRVFDAAQTARALPAPAMTGLAP